MNNALYPLTQHTSVSFKDTRSKTPTSRVTTRGLHQSRRQSPIATTRQPSDTESLPTNCFVHTMESPSPPNIRCILYHVYGRYIRTNSDLHCEITTCSDVFNYNVELHVQGIRLYNHQEPQMAMDPFSAHDWFTMDVPQLVFSKSVANMLSTFKSV